MSDADNVLVLKYLKDLRALLTEAQWCQKNYALDGSGQPVTSTSPYACRWCLVGGIHRVTVGDASVHRMGVRNALVTQLEGYSPSVIPDSVLIGFNDRSTHADMIALIDAAIAARTP